MHSQAKTALFLGLALSIQAHAGGFEIFARGSASKNHLTQSSYIVSISAATGVAVTLIPQVRIEARYTNASSLQNKMTFESTGLVGSLNDIMTQTSIYSVGLDLDILGPQSTFQPFIYVGVGYVRTERSYFFLEDGSVSSIYWRDPVQTGISANGGAGFRIKIADAISFELEAFAYAIDVHTPNPILNLFGSAGIRLHL